MPRITSVRLIVGLEAHIELATRSKMFARAPNPAHRDYRDAPPNTLIDPETLALPGSLPTINRRAVEMALMVGLALDCSVAPLTKWDRKGYFYPDLPKNYQISQYDLPLCANGAAFVPDPEQGPDALRRIRILRAHLEEDAGKLLHQAPGGAPLDHSIIDLNRAGTPLLEVVTAPDFTTADQVVAFAQMLRTLCRFLAVSEGDMQRGHMRFEPNINTLCALDDGREVRTPIVEIKNLNSFRSLRAAVEHELQRQPRQFLADGLVMAPGAKSTRGWDDHLARTIPQRHKEDAHDYRYFPDPDLPPLHISDEWRESIRAALPELPHIRAARYQRDFSLAPREAAALVEDRETCLFFEACLDEAAPRDDSERTRLGRGAANLILQSAFKRANERHLSPDRLGITPAQLAGIVRLRDAGRVNAAAADELLALLCESDESPEACADRMGFLRSSDARELEAWCDAVIDDPANARAVADLRAGKAAAIGRLVGEVMKRSAGKADAKAVRDLLAARLTSSPPAPPSVPPAPPTPR